MTYVDVNGLATWHEIHGQGRLRVHVPERRGHAHTPDVPGPCPTG